MNDDMPHGCIEIGDTHTNCRHCRQPITVADSFLGLYLGSNGSYWCEGNDRKDLPIAAMTYHEPAAQ